VAISANECIVPKLILQPIIENCINHGYKKKEVLNIIISIQIDLENLIMVIHDDGEGMTKSDLSKLLARLNSEDGESNHIGINNVNRRLKLLYGPEYGLDIESEEDVGTKVTIRMPIEKW
jgi:sensor histidine kinase YesM